MSSQKTARVERVLSGALRVWAVSARVGRDPERADTLVVVKPPSGAAVRILPAAPHGWLVFRDSHLLGTHAGLPGLLRALRDELAPDAPAGRLVFGAPHIPARDADGR